MPDGIVTNIAALRLFADRMRSVYGAKHRKICGDSYCISALPAGDGYWLGYSFKLKDAA